MKPSNQKLKTVLLAVLVAVSGSALAQGQQAIAQVDYDVHQLSYPPLSDVEVPEPRVVKLDNGLSIYLLEDHELPQISMSARIGTGSLWEPADMIGLASLTGSVMRTGGTASMSPDEIDQALANIGATVETGIGDDSGFAFMNTLTGNIDTVLPIFADVLMHPAFAEEKVKLAKTRTNSSIGRRNDNPPAVARREFTQLLYGADSPYARVPQYYTIDKISRDDMVAFHDQYFVPNNVQLAVWGDFDSDRMVDRLRDAFGGWKADPDFVRPEPPPIKGSSDVGVHFISDPDVTQSIVLMGHLGEITKDNPDYFPVIVMNQVLSGGFAGRLMHNVRSEQGLAYSVYGGYSTGYDHKGTFRAGVGTKSATTVEAAKSVEEQIRSMQTKAPTAEELRIAKEAYLNSFVFNFDTRREILGRLMTYDYYGYPQDFLEQIEQGVEKVTSADVMRVAKKYLHPDRLDILVLGNKEQMEQPLSNLAADGEVELIDISIPTTAPGAEAAPAGKADKAAGAALFGKVRDALGGAVFDSLRTLKSSSTATAHTPRGDAEVKSTVAVAFPDKVNVAATMPGGMQVHMVGVGDKMVLKMGGQVMPAPPQLQSRTAAQLWRGLGFLMVRADAVSAALGEDVTVDGKTLQALVITPPDGIPSFTLLIDPKTKLPARVRYQAMTPMGPAEGEDILSDYRQTDGVTLPFAVKSMKDGEVSAEGIIDSVEINPELDPALFSTE